MVVRAARRETPRRGAALRGRSGSLGRADPGRTESGPVVVLTRKQKAGSIAPGLKSFRVVLLVRISQSQWPLEMQRRNQRSKAAALEPWRPSYHLGRRESDLGNGFLPAGIFARPWNSFWNQSARGTSRRRIYLCA